MPRFAKFYVYATWGGRLQWRSLNHTLERALRDAAYERRNGCPDAYVEHADTGERFYPS